MKTANVFKYTGFGILGVGFIFLFIWIIMLLWNSLVPELFNGPELTYWQAAGILVLSKILFSGFGGGGHKSNKHEKKWKSAYYKKYHAAPEESQQVEETE